MIFCFQQSMLMKVYRLLPYPHHFLKLPLLTPVLYQQDRDGELRFCHENPSIIAIYKDYLGKPLSEDLAAEGCAFQKYDIMNL